jgi:hypothetical protein
VVQNVLEKTKTNLIGHCLSGEIGQSLFQIRSWITCFETNFQVKNITHGLSSAVINGECYAFSISKAGISQATDHWPHTSLKISRTRWVKAVISWLFGIIWKKNTDISVLFFRYRFSFFFKYRNSLYGPRTILIFTGIKSIKDYDYWHMRKK